MGGDGVQHRFACALICAMLILLIPLIVFAPATVPKAHTHPGASVEVAEMYINKRRASNRLVVMILSGKPPALCRVLENLRDFAFPWTSMDVFVFSHNNTAAEKVGCENQVRTCDLAAQSPGDNCTSNDTNIFFLPLQEEWRTPVEAGGRHTWQTGFPEEYRRMGHWRLTFQMSFAHRLGYPYLLQLDDDSHFTSPLKIDLLHFVRSRGLDLAARKANHDPTWVAQGLPELTRYFLVTEGINIPPALSQNCDPPNIEGLYTASSFGLGGGWNRRVLYGNFMIVSTAFWHRPDVQSYLQLILKTGGHFRFRWNEQGVNGMVWQLFAEQRYHIFDFPYQHAEKDV